MLLPVAVLLPLGVATLLLVCAHLLPSRVSTMAAIVTALTVAAICVLLARAALAGPLVHWFGGWTPATSGRPDVVLGISLMADPASAAVAAFTCLMFAASFVFAWGYFDEVHSHFEVLMLLFLAALVGFCLTHDMFNLFVWFELMSVAAFALTAYPLGKSSLEGAFNFTITNALGSFMMLAGVGLLYARTGTLDFTTMARVVTAHGADPVLSGGFCLVAAALLTKGAIVPFHLWLSDAHAVAPSPVSVIFSGIMVSAALFVLAKIAMQIFAHDPPVMALVRNLLLWLGLATAIVGGAMAYAQRHLKRLLAFSTIAHLGIMLTAVSAASPRGMAALLLYMFGHGLVKGTLFMLAGVLLALRASADEIVLYRKGRDLLPAGIAMTFAGLMLGGLPVGLMHQATDILDELSPAMMTAAIVASALTGAAVLRAAARIFFGVSGAPGPEMTAPTERERERDERPLWLMLLPCAALLAMALAQGAAIDRFIGFAAPRLIDPAADASAPVAAHSSPTSYLPIALTLVLALLSAVRRRPVRPFPRSLVRLELFPFRALRFLHSGLVADYVAWMIVGFAILAGMLSWS
ncbi:MAG TPA: proton-conducting transporter membrane subunit [Xanthobacteraceae bacterium]|nr:proton-conducting transporter membrane subunit [Xanthobacteraceae bacterium]